MAIDELDGTPVLGAAAKRFRVYRTDLNDEPYECEGAYDTVEEVNSHYYHQGARYKISVSRMYFTRKEFATWVKEQRKG